jgi:hypothetical protein
LTDSAAFWWLSARSLATLTSFDRHNLFSASRHPRRQLLTWTTCINCMARLSRLSLIVILFLLVIVGRSWQRAWVHPITLKPTAP